MFRSFNLPLAGMIASLSAIMVAATIAGFAAFWSGVAEVKAEPQVEATLHQLHAKADPLPVLVKGPACSLLG